MLALSSLVLAVTLFATPAARAGSWTYVISGDNTGSTFTDNGVNVGAPAYSPATTSIGTPGSSASTYAYTVNRASNGSTGSGCSIHLVVHAQVTFTWHPDPNLSSDPPPDNVMVQESATAFWSASSGDSMHAGSVSGDAANGLSDAEYDPPNDPNHAPPLVYQSAYMGVGYSGPPPNSSYPNPVPALVPHFTTYSASSGTVTVASRTLTVNANATASSWYYGAKAIAGSYSASIHPQPYNFTQATGSVYGNYGALQFTYTWLSTSGSLSDLGSCYWHERVTYPGGDPYTPSAPFDGTSSYPNPTIAPGLLDQGGQMTSTAGTDTHYPWASPGFRSSYSSATVTATQRYEFDDLATGQTNVLIPGPDSANSIVRSVTNNHPPYLSSVWWYTCTKNGVTSWVQLN